MHGDVSARGQSLPAHYRRLVLQRFAETFVDATEIVETPLGLPGTGELLVRNHWAGVNGVFDDRLARNRVEYLDISPPCDIGIECVGEVVAIGEGVTGFRPGDAVATTRLGNGYREYLCVAADQAIPIAAATPEILTLIPTGISALVALEQVAELRAGERIVISAAAGGLGHLLVQLARLKGAHVVGLAGTAEKCAAVAALGAHEVFNYREADLDAIFRKEYPQGFDVAYDTVGGRIFDLFLTHVAVRGRVICSGYTADIENPEPVTRPRIYTSLYWKAASVRGFMNPLFGEHHADAARRLLQMYADGSLRVLVDASDFRGLESVPQAIEHLLAGRNLGKVVVRLT
ncbi:MAG: alcohol dehydrogenase [Gammaproteobacteria bacterium]|nr:MAG: alcohol dehydrogenase [Gammaproteobacteria bacterium]